MSRGCGGISKKFVALHTAQPRERRAAAHPRAADLGLGISRDDLPQNMGLQLYLKCSRHAVVALTAQHADSPCGLDERQPPAQHNLMASCSGSRGRRSTAIGPLHLCGNGSATVSGITSAGRREELRRSPPNPSGRQTGPAVFEATFPMEKTTSCSIALPWCGAG